MSLNEPLAWPFHREHLEQLAARIRSWNRSGFNVPPARYSWNTETGSLQLVNNETSASASAAVSAAEATADQPVPLSIPIQQESRNIQVSATGSTFVPAFERDDEDDSELDIQPGDRIKQPDNTRTSGNDDEGWGFS